MQDKPQTRTLSIRLPEDLADRLDAVARQHGTTRTAVLIEILDGAIDTYSPATHSATRPQHDTLSGAIETIRIELDETIDRVARLERATRPATQPATHIARQTHDEATRDGKTFTTQELIDLYGWSPKNGTRNARKNGWIEVGQQGREILWQAPPQG
jgi:predicted DNA-binding protein